MQLNVSAIYWPDADEVVVDINSTEDDGITVTLANSVSLSLLLETKDLIGTKSYSVLSDLTIDSEFARNDKSYAVRFRNPRARMDLFMDIVAAFGSEILSKRVRVGISESLQTDISLPENRIWEIDPLEDFSTGGSEDILPENTVVLAPEIRSFVKNFNFGSPQPVEDYEGLVYRGGADSRLLLSSRTNSYQLQQGKPPWELPAFLFAEDSAQNLVTNAFFLNGTDTPQGWTLDAAGSAFVSVLDFDHQTSSDAKLWKVSIKQTNPFVNFDRVVFQHADKIPIMTGETYTFSAYAKMKKRNPTTIVKNISFSIDWYDGNTLLSSSVEALTTDNFKSLSLGAGTHTAPVGATHAVPKIEFFQVDAGDDIDVTIFAPQLEVGALPTTRILSSRDQDIIEIPQYNAANQKIRLQAILGFDQQQIATSLILVDGVLTVALDDSSIIVTLGADTVQAPLVVPAGELLDITIAHISNGKLQLYRAGDLLAETTLGEVLPTAAPLLILGAGFELLKLNFFSRN